MYYCAILKANNELDIYHTQAEITDKTDDESVTNCKLYLDPYARMCIVPKINFDIKVGNHLHITNTEEVLKCLQDNNIKGVNEKYYRFNFNNDYFKQDGYDYDRTRAWLDQNNRRYLLYVRAGLLELPLEKDIAILVPLNQ